MDANSPTIPPPLPEGLSEALRRNIRVLEDRRKHESDAATREEKLAGAITRFSGSMPFVYAHLVLFCVWILGNIGFIPGFPRFDPSLIVLAMVAWLRRSFCPRSS